MKHFIYCTIPGLRQQDITQMPNLQALVSNGSQQRLTTSFPGVTWPAQASMLTGKLPSEHGVIANGFYWRDEKEIEMWTNSVFLPSSQHRKIAGEEQET